MHSTTGRPDGACHPPLGAGPAIMHPDETPLLSSGLPPAAAAPYPGATLVAGGVRFRVFATGKTTVAVVVEGREQALTSAGDGYFETVVAGIGAGARYGFRIDGGAAILPDPASRSQPDGVMRLSEVVDPDSYRWTDADWPGIAFDGAILYEMHVGTFTPEGTWAAAADKLPYLKDLGITAIEMMPVGVFSGRYGWGYDGVHWSAPAALYGRPDDLRAFIDRAHALGIGVILDVVYNHVGAEGNVLDDFSADHFTDRYHNDWGASFNFDGDKSAGARDLVIGSAVGWIAEYHVDGLRIDATQSIFDTSEDHILAALTRAARVAAGSRRIVLIAENEPQHPALLRPAAEGGFGMDASWNDDFHHSAMVALTGRNEAYYEDHAGLPAEFIAAAKYGYLFQGQLYAHQGKGRGLPGLDLAGRPFVNFLQNHDQIANSGFGIRFHALTSPGRARAMTALMLLMPGAPMLFQGQEFWASTPFRYFADPAPERREAVHQSRVKELSQFPSLRDPKAIAAMTRPEMGFAASRLDWAEAKAKAGILGMHRDLIHLRRSEPALQSNSSVDGAVIGAEAFLLRFRTADDRDLALFVNFGRDLHLRSIPDPLTAPPAACDWSLAWSSEDPAYGGSGTPAFLSKEGWHLPGHAALLLGTRRVGPPQTQPGEP